MFIYCNLGESSAALAQNFADLGLTEFDGVDARFNAIWRAFELAVRRLGVTRKGSRDERCPSPAP
ncbi:MAG TPA: hypothetical protein VFQ35_06560 [Polyangiaceae bacterium]|nr:hypothetical protein [Polyangiaceae bacterium]